MDYPVLWQAQEALDLAIEEGAYENDGEARRLVLQVMLMLRTAMVDERKTTDTGAALAYNGPTGGGLEMSG